MNGDSLTRSNIERAIQDSFKIKGKSRTRDEDQTDVEEAGVEISGTATASQEVRELNDILRHEGFGPDKFLDFAPNGKWSVLNMNKIKVQWATRCQQTRIDGTVWNIVPGRWEGSAFLPNMLSSMVKVKMTPSTPVSGLGSEPGAGHVLIPHGICRTLTDIPLRGGGPSPSTSIPQLRFLGKTLECVSPRSLMCTSVNRQGIYINRKYRDKIELVSPPEDRTAMLREYRLDIYYKDELLSSQNI
jgi:hypothetical protein